MATEIRVSKKNVVELLREGAKFPFVIPEYQRPYAWDHDEIQVLFDDLWDFTLSEVEKKQDGNTYFLGSIVSFEGKDENNKNYQEIIDGQQRITTLFLLLRAIYTMLNTPQVKTPQARHFINVIAPTIWNTDEMTGEVDYSSILLTSKVMNNNGNYILQHILESGEADDNAKDNYSRNYIKLQSLLKEKASDDPLMFYRFILTVLNKAIVLPITAESQDTALTIFSTLNDRGKPLSDADIFKAKIYSNLEKEERADFIEKWKTLDENATAASESLQQLFYYYMFYLRALEEDRNTTTPGVRKYLSENKFERLKRDHLMDDLQTFLNIWRVVNSGMDIEGESWSKNRSILKTLDILKSYPNEFWKYPVLIYYIVHRESQGFEEAFGSFLNKLTVELLDRFLIAPTVAAVKGEIMKLNAAIINSMHPAFEFKETNAEEMKSIYRTPHPRIVRMMLKMYAYTHPEQEQLIGDGWEIEHIFPQRWQNEYFPRDDESTVREKIEYLGNKTPFEKKLNIVASNGYFRKKQQSYADSKFAVTKALSSRGQGDWGIDDIVERGIRVSDTLKDLMTFWRKQYVERANR